VRFHIIVVGMHQIGQATNWKASDFPSHIVSMWRCLSGLLLCQFLAVGASLMQAQDGSVVCDQMCPQIIIRQLSLGVLWA